MPRMLIVNAGSSSLKLRVLGDDDAVERSDDLDLPAGESLAEALRRFLEDGAPVWLAGHRVVHGGPDFQGPVVVDDSVEKRLDGLSELAPLHNPPALAAIRALQRTMPELVQVACFDTGFHASIPPAAHTYAIPAAWTRRWGLRRYGFHGLSHAYASRRGAQLLGRPVEDLRLVTAHLGSGASLAAVNGGRSVDTTMGFTPLEGLVMATRSGSVDPGLVLWVQRHGGFDAATMERALEKESGLAGLAGSVAPAGDLRQVLKAIDSGDEEAWLAYDVYLHRLRGEISSMVAAMGGVDGVVFTGGVGERSPRVRADTCAGLGFLGFGVDGSANDRFDGGDRRVTAPGCAAEVMVVAAREDLEIARQVRQVLASRSPQGGRAQGSPGLESEKGSRLRTPPLPPHGTEGA